MRTGTYLQDVDWSGVDSDDLGTVLRELPRIIDLLEELILHAPFVRQSRQLPGCTENTEAGQSFSDLLKWLQYQAEEAYQTLRENPPTTPSMAEFRALDIIRHMAGNTGDLTQIATEALTLDANPDAALPRRPHSWVKRYLSERNNHA